MRIKKVHWLAICLLCVVMAFSAISCADEMPEDQMIPDDQSGHKEASPIDWSLYEENEIFQNTKYIKNMPGVLLVCDQSHGATLYYVNKASGEERIYCFDPLCQHGNCAAYHFYLPRNLVYHPYDGCIYGTTVEHGLGSGTELYRIDLQTQEIEIVWPGKGNYLEQYLYAHEQYIYFPVKNEEKGYDVMRYDADTQELELMSAPKGKAFMKFLYICGDKIIVRFMDEKELYQTDEDFSQFTPLGLEGLTYFDQERVILPVATEGNIFGFKVQDFGSESATLFFESNVAILNLGYDGTYVYYAEYKQAVGGSAGLDDTLFRVCVDNGVVEELCSLGGTPMEIACYDGNVYYHTKKYLDGSPEFFYGKLVKTENGFVAEDFEIEHP